MEGDGEGHKHHHHSKKGEEEAEGGGHHHHKKKAEEEVGSEGGAGEGEGDAEEGGEDTPKKSHHKHSHEHSSSHDHRHHHQHHHAGEGEEDSSHGKKREREHKHHHHHHKDKKERKEESREFQQKYADVQPGDAVDKAAVHLQKMWRSRQEKRKVTKLVLLDTWNVLDYDDERKGLQADRRFADLDAVVKSQVALVEKPQKKKKKKSKKEKHHHHHHHHSEEKKEDTAAAPPPQEEGDKMGVDKGTPAETPEEEKKEEKAHLTVKARRGTTNELVQLEYFWLAVPETITHSFIKVLIKNFKKGRVLKKKCVNKILDRFHALMQGTPAIQDISVPEGGRVCVVGDTHGQLADLLTILRLNGYPSATNTYLFNGDFVDRGSFGSEICLLLFLFKLCDPKSVYLNRGNHECRRLNEKYAFEEEVNLKYDASVFDKYQNIFCSISIATLISDKIFVTHGGLFREDNVTIEELRKVNINQQIPAKSDSKYDQYFEDMMWSDPRPIDGRGKSTRGAGVLFGGDVTRNFLQTNDLKTVIRSHELMAKGYGVLHDYQLITVFSASNYCGTNDNYGAIIILKADLSPEFIRYKADPHERLIKNFSLDMLRENTVTMLREKIYNYRVELGKHFARCKQETPGFVTRLDWAAVMGEVLDLKELQWLWLQPLLAEAEPKTDHKKPTLINYKRFLERYQIQIDQEVMDKWEDLLVKEVMVKLYQKTKGMTPEEAFNSIAKRDTAVTKKEFVQNLCGMTLALTGSQVSIVANALDVDQNEEITKEEFMSRFQPVYHEIEAQEKKDEEWLNIALKVLGRVMRMKATRLEKIFKKFDKDGDRGLSYAEFGDAIRKLGLGKKYSTEQRMKIAEFIDQDKNGVIDWVEFSAAFKENDAWKKEAIQRICNVLYTNRFGLKRIFALFDTDHSGALDVDEFKAGLRVLNRFLDPPLSDWQVEQLHHAIDTNGDGAISYAEFVAAFKVVDTHGQTQ